jgi:hypothetical protein
MLYETAGLSAVLSVYHAVDICTQQAALVNRFFALCGLPAAAVCGDLAGGCFACDGAGRLDSGQMDSHLLLPAVDLAFLFKLLPVLEAQTPGSGFALLRNVTAKHLAVTYPLKSLTGKEKGMARHYRHTFETALSAGQLAPYAPLAESCIGAEWVIVLGQQ